MMLQKLRDQTQSKTFKAIVFVLIASLALFGFGAFNVFVTSDVTVASVNGEDITRTELSQAVERERRRLAMQYGEQLDQSLIDPLTLEGPVLESLISRELLRQTLEQFDISVARAEVDRTLIENPGFQIDGQFNDQAYRRAISAAGYTPQTFLEETTLMMSVEQLRQGVAETAVLPDWEMRQLARLVGQKRDLAWLSFTASHFEPQVVVSQEDVDLHYDENQGLYLTAEAVDVDYVVLDWNELVDDPSIEVAEEEIVAAYESDRLTADLEQRDSSHILLRATDERDAETTVRLLEDIRARIENGADFAELAAEYSEDPGSANNGGALGLVGKGVFDPAFEEALWAMEETGQLSEPVESTFGYHLIRLDGIEQREYPTLDEERDSIATRLRSTAADELYEERLRELDNLAFEQFDSLEGISVDLGLEIQNLAGVTRETGEAEFTNTELRDAVFAIDVLEDGANTAAVSLDDTRAVVARVVERHPPRQLELDEVRERIQGELVATRSSDLAQEAHDAAVIRVEAGESVADVAATYDLAWQTQTLAARNQAGVPGPVTRKAFDLSRPLENEKTVGSADVIDGQAIVTVTRVVDGDLAAMSDSEAEDLRRAFQERSNRNDFAALFQSLREAADIERL